ncbi:probable helicase senataxin isoform X1 [Hypanus sabinus]|uniref:probable helicase senataxin isoform X1 n=1 Tax=Hypanus sabinus TaxID=79690 RepID=UPI0028C4C4C9|nr:probable helicase senataxin isoform X1 [Hypanus sabinus]XP_059849765.1 probable helicase senataxin isoform X1 [Hypanus sabinus]XP_059849766.1 probable helicase senataxin isoform X1 [Hypanus sabinus]XP_059849767.1 probable helicase senataxin isoform X1 [Hypanus sabinus]
MNTCRWCTPQHQSTSEFLRSYSSEVLSSEELKAANEDLCYCLECVVEYHRARDELPEAHKVLWKIETKRLVEHFERTLKEEEEEDDDLFIVLDQQEIQLHGCMATNIENDLRVPIIEILKYPYLLLHERLSELYVEALTRMEQGNFSFQIFDKYPGIYLLLVHPNEMIRKWAILAARSLGKVERDDFYDLQEVITCLLKVIELDLFENTDFYHSYGMEEGKLILLPPHLYDVTNHKNYWLGICMLLMVLDEQAMDSLLLAPDKQNDFMKSILNTMMKSKPGDASDPFWPALQCFMVILDRLGSKVWGHLSDPTEAFQAIIESQSYNDEIEKIRNSRNNTNVKYDLDADVDDDMVSCSQIVYDYNSRKQSKNAGGKYTTCGEYYPSMYDEMQSLEHVLQCDIGQDMRVHNSTFLWFIPFVNSVMDLKDRGIAYIGEVVHHIYCEIKDVLNQKVDFCDKVTEFFIIILVSIIELHRNKNCLHLLWYSSQKWVEALVKCVSLPARLFNQTTERTATMGNYKVSSTVFAVTPSSANSPITNSAQRSCVQLIRSFLREGCQSQQRSIFQPFLDKLNLQLRSTFILGWQLNLKEQQDLQSCLRQLVKNAKYKSSEVKQLDTFGKRSGQQCPIIKREKEDTGVWGKMPGYCNSGPGPPDPLFQMDNKSLLAQKSTINQEEMAACIGQEDWPNKSSEDGDFQCKAKSPFCNDRTFLNETRTNEANVLKVGKTDEKLSSGVSTVELSPLPLETAGANVNFIVSSFPNDNLQTEPLEETPGIHHKGNWKQSMLLEFQKSFSDTATKSEAESTISNHPAVTCPAASVCDLLQKMDSDETPSYKFKIDPNKLRNLKDKMQAINIKGKVMKTNNSKERKLEDLPTIGIDSSQLDYINIRNDNQNPDFSKSTINGSSSIEHVTTSPPQLSPFCDKREKLLNSDNLILGPLSLRKVNSSNDFKAPNLSNQSHQHTINSIGSDDIPLKKLRAKLKKGIALTRVVNTGESKTNKDLGMPLEVTSLDKIQALNRIDRRVNVSRHVQLCDSVQHEEKSEFNSSVEEPRTNKGAEVDIFSLPSTKENNNMLEVERPGTKNQVSEACGTEITNSPVENKTSLQEMPTSSEPLPTPFEEYDSQVFEFESEEQVYSVWEDVQPNEQKVEEVKPEDNDESDETAVNSKFKEKPVEGDVSDIHTNSDDADVNSMFNEWGYDTDYVPDELIEKVAEEVEAQLAEEITASKTDNEKQLLLGVKQISPCNSAGNLQKEKQKHSKIAIGHQNLTDKSKHKLASAKYMPNKKQARKVTGRDESVRNKNGISEKYLSHVSSRKDLNKFILTKQSTNGNLDQKAKKNNSIKTSDQKSIQTSLPNTSEYSVKKMVTPSTSSPKKVRKCPEPTSTVEKLGLKKKTRKALDLSQGSLDNLNKLRNYGQAVGTIEDKCPKKTKLIMPPKLSMTRNSRLLVSQDRQYLRQSRTRRHNKEKKKSPSDEIVSPKRALSFTERQDSSNSVQTNQKLPSTSVENSSNSIHTTSASFEKEISSSLTERNLSSINVSDDLNLTQRDPLDMDISDESLEDDLLNLTQRDPVDMDIENDTTEEDSSIKSSNSNLTYCHYTGCTAVTASSESLCQDHAASQPKDDVFAKPGLPLSDLKSSRPSTTKLFASSSTSRNAQLATEMEAIPKRPAVAASKVPQFQKPAAVKFTVPQALRPVQPAKHVGTNILCAQNQDVDFRGRPSFPTPVAASRSMHGTLPAGRSARAASYVPMIDHRQRDPFELINSVLKWKYEMFDMFDRFGATENLCEFPLRDVPDKFRSYEEYFNTFYPLLMLNLFEQLAQKLMEYKQTNKMIQNKLMLKNYCIEGRINRAEFQAFLQNNELVKQLYPKEDDVVFLWLPQRYNYYMQEETETNEVLIPHIAHVSRTSRFSGRDSRTTLHLSIRTRGNVSAVENQPVRCDVIGSMVTTIRQFKGLLFLAKSPLWRPVISPHYSFFEQDVMGSTKWSNANDYNAHQQKAINIATSMVKQPRIPKVCFIQGPPGTGKSKTIVGLLHRLLDEDQENDKPSYNGNMRAKHARILVCAPSNAAIDDLMKKIITDFKWKRKDKDNCLGNCGDVNLIRLGTEKAISTDVIGFSLDHQVNRKMKKDQTDPDQIQRQKDWLDMKLDELGKECAIIKKDSEQMELAIQKRRKLERERAELGRKLKEVQGRTQDIQLKVILESHIICCTLSTSGSTLLEMSFRKLGHEPFSCVVVDEAGQACETEILIPLMYGCPKLILVGDPEQLPPTIISMKAKELGYGRSMMCRIQRCLQGEVNQSNFGRGSALLLLTQYRMHPDICLFPSKYIYSNKLKTDANVEVERCRLSWPFQSYMLFDVTDGYERRDKDSYANPQEVKLVMALISMIAEKHKGSCRKLGVITPYNAQKQEIINQIEHECRKDRLENGRAVQVGTVDGFQGCEKDCIIVSCVRANSLQGSIGFLADRQRMNVTITRARFSLFILGHLKTLMEDKDWNALIQDAKKRGAIVKTREKEYKKDCLKVTKPRPAYHRNVSDPGAYANERELVPPLKKFRRESLNLSVASNQFTDISNAKVPKQSIPSQPAALQQPCWPQASASVQPAASSTARHPQTSGRSEQSSHYRQKDPRLARREALSIEVQPQLKTDQSFSKSSDALPPHSSSGRHETTHASHFGQMPRNSVSWADDASTSKSSSAFPSGASVDKAGNDTAYRLNKSVSSRRDISAEKEKKYDGQQKRRGY